MEENAKNDNKYSELTHGGSTLEEAREILKSAEFKTLKNVVVAGVMGMATYTENEEQIRNEFKMLNLIFKTLKNEYFSRIKEFREISMGMSGDYLLAVEEGSTLIRVGSKIFGARNY